MLCVVFVSNRTTALPEGTAITHFPDLSALPKQEVLAAEAENTISNKILSAKRPLLRHELYIEE